MVEIISQELSKAIQEHSKHNNIIDEINKEINGLKYGSVLITVHDNKIKQIETVNIKRPKY